MESETRLFGEHDHLRVRPKNKEPDKLETIALSMWTMENVRWEMLNHMQ